MIFYDAGLDCCSHILCQSDVAAIRDTFLEIICQAAENRNTKHHPFNWVFCCLFLSRITVSKTLLTIIILTKNCCLRIGFAVRWAVYRISYQLLVIIHSSFFYQLFNVICSIYAIWPIFRATNVDFSPSCCYQLTGESTLRACGRFTFRFHVCSFLLQRNDAD